MWVFLKYIIFVLLLLLVTLTFSNNYIQFALLSELCWICIYCLTLVLSSGLEDYMIFLSCILVIILTAIEGIVIWSIVFLIKLS